MKANNFQLSTFNFQFSIALTLLFAFGLLCSGQSKSGLRSTPAPLDPIKAEKEGRILVADLLSKKPDQNITNTGVLRIRDANRKERQIPVRFAVGTNSNNWVSIYETMPQPGEVPERLVVIHADGQPNRYELISGNDKKTLTGEQLMVPFAGSDFWIADLGLEFLHWPKQQVLRNQMSHGRSCSVLESINPQPASNGYASIHSWIDVESGGIVHAEAFDAAKKRIKQFDPTGLKKVKGQRELEEMEMRNEKTGSQSWVKYDLE